MHAFTAVTTFDNYDISIVLNELTKEIQLNWSMEINVLLNMFRKYRLDIFYVTISINGLIMSDINRHVISIAAYTRFTYL